MKHAFFASNGGEAGVGTGTETETEMEMSASNIICRTKKGRKKGEGD